MCLARWRSRILTGVEFHLDMHGRDQARLVTEAKLISRACISVTVTCSTCRNHDELIWIAHFLNQPQYVRRAYTRTKRFSDGFPRDLELVWDALPEDEVPNVDALLEYVIRLEDRIRKGQKVCHMFLTMIDQD